MPQTFKSKHRGEVGKLSLPSGDPQGIILTLHGAPGGASGGNQGLFDRAAQMATSIGFGCLQLHMPEFGFRKGLEEAHRQYVWAVGYMSERFGVPLHILAESAGSAIATLPSNREAPWCKDILSYAFVAPAFDLCDQ